MADVQVPRHRAGGRYPPPARRRLRVFSLDPTLSRLEGVTAVLSVPWEPLKPGPVGARVRVVDWDETLNEYAAAADLDDPYLLAQDGLAPSEADREFRQQMVYAVISSLLETLDQARGRRLQWCNVWRRPGLAGRPAMAPMPVYPQSLHEANAHYRPGEGLHFGVFHAAGDGAGTLFPGQLVYGCLSHDIVNHETTHAFLHELRPRSFEPTGPDAIAFHEGFADIMAILQHFRLPGLLEAQVVRTGTALWEPGPFIELAGEFGRGAGRGEAIRQALDNAASPTSYDQHTEPHQRGAVLVAAFFDAFFAAYRYRIADLVRLAGVSGPQVPGQVLPQDLVTRVAMEARVAAAMVQGMAVRAIDYLPPVDITFGDFLEAVLTADTDLFPEDRDGFRRSLVESCRRRGIYPAGITAPEHSVAKSPAELAALEPLPTREALILAADDLRHLAGPRPRSLETEARRLDKAWRQALLGWGRRNAPALGLDAADLQVDGGNASFRWTQDGQPTAVVTARFIAQAPDTDARLAARLGGVQLTGGATVIAGADGVIRHLCAKPVPRDTASGLPAADPGRAALQRILAFSDDCAERSGLDPGERRDDPRWMHTLHSLARVHGGGIEPPGAGHGAHPG